MTSFTAIILGAALLAVLTAVAAGIAARANRSVREFRESHHRPFGVKD